jgi:predicted anti-sigma-YlaC factor YlaD
MMPWVASQRSAHLADMIDHTTAIIVLMRHNTNVLYRGALSALVALASGCSLQTMAVNAVMPTLANPEVYLSEEDPELIRNALPFLLKTIESVLETEPLRRDALLFANNGFLLYANAFLQNEAALAEWSDYELAAELNERARRMYLRARNYGLRLVEIEHPGITDRLFEDPEAAVMVFDVEDVETLYYLGGAWMLGINLSLDRPALVADLPTARALLDRALLLDESYNKGVLHTAFITVESVGEALGGSYQRAREHFDRAVGLSEGLDAGPYISMAVGVSIAEENRQEFVELLETVLAIDVDKEPANRLFNVLSQKRARMLLDHVDDLFFEPITEESGAEQGVS